ncbi:MAG: hypothetical protein H0X24_09455 [Ktedonobacterales bacterium]|nr:hypothetical protein [Ktedonobacterales bacterium]
MRRLLMLGLAALLMTSGLAACGSGATATDVAVGSKCLSRSGDYVQSSGTGLVVGNQPLTLYAATIYPDVTVSGKTYRGSAWTMPTFTTYLDQWITQAAAAKINTIRATDFLSNVDDWRNPTVWANMDYLLCHARTHGMHVIISLTTFGKMLYQQGNFPYDPGAWGALIDFVGTRYRNERALAYYAILGEALPPNGNDPLRATPNQLLAFYRDTSLQLRTVDSGHHLISTGGLSFLNGDYGIPWQDIFALPTIDLAAIHVYSAGDRDITLPNVAAWSAQNDKPFVIEEFGFQQKLGDAARAAAFADILARARTAKAAGVGFWNLGPEVADKSYDVSAATPLTWDALQKGAP